MSDINDHLLAFEIDVESRQITLHGNAEGLEHMARTLMRLAKRARGGELDHDHLFSENWGGWELATALPDQEGVLADHVKIYALPESVRGRSSSDT